MTATGRGFALNMLLRRILVVEFALAAFCFALFTWHWMLICDSPIMHYVNFLMANGMKPYSQITDNNLPGAYLSEAFGMWLFGASDIAWRVYEFFLLGLLTTAMVTIALPYDWVAGVIAGGMFLFMHGTEGPWFAGERELVMTALVMAGYAAMFTATRKGLPLWMFLGGFCFAFGTAIKPTILPLSPLLLLWLIFYLKGKKTAWLPYAGYGVAGTAAAALCNLGFLLAHHAVGDFINIQRTITPYYAALIRLSASQMLLRLVPPKSILFILILGAVLVLANRKWNAEYWALALGAIIGLLSYWEQGKGFVHHRYMFLAFLLLLASLEVMRSLRSVDWRRWVSVSLLLVIAVLVPKMLYSIKQIKPDSDLTVQMEADLTTLSSHGSLQRRVQCLDLVFGCLNALYHLKLVENTGFTGDMLIFDPVDGPAVEAHRTMWWKLAQNDPADILVVTNEFFQGSNGYDKLDNWPAYHQYLDENYTMLVQRSFPMETNTYVDPAHANGYRIYVRRNSPFSSATFVNAPATRSVTRLPDKTKN